jgi:AcrR family transcriptional regulator
MSGLRERSKAKRRDAMLHAAAALFSEFGYGETHMEMIAEQAEVALSTLYQYFPSKAELSRAIYAQDIAAVRARQEEVIGNPPADPVEAVMALMRNDLYCSPDYTNRETWRQITVAGLLSPIDNDLGTDPFSEPDAEPFFRLLQRLQRDGVIVEEADIRRLAGLLSTINVSAFLHLVTTSETREASLARAREFVDLVLRPLSAKPHHKKG